MNRKLMFMRHGKSDWDAASKSDFDRPLNSRGKRDVPELAAWMKNKKIIPGLILSSTAKRAEQTTKLLTRALKIRARSVEYLDSLYDSGLSSYLYAIEEHLDFKGNILVVGHNPIMDQIVSYLSTESPPETIKGKLMTTSALAVFQYEQTIAEHQLELQYLIRPKEI